MTRSITSGFGPGLAVTSLGMSSTFGGLTGRTLWLSGSDAFTYMVNVMVAGGNPALNGSTTYCSDLFPFARGLQVR